MGMFKSYVCTGCGHKFEGILAICGKCGARGSVVSGLQSCLESGKPPGCAGGRNTPHSARSYDRAFERNFAIMGISNLTHKDGVPVVTRARNPQLKYNTMPGWAGRQEPIRAYSSMESMRKDGVRLPAMRIDGQPFVPPNVHPVVEPGAVVGKGLSESMRRRTVITHRHSG